MRYQDESPIQARGFALFHLKDGGDPERTLFWYDAKGKSFAREVAGGRRNRAETGAEIGPVAGWFWKLAGNGMDLAKAAVIAIAFLAAFLTIVELWEIPPPKTPLTQGAATGDGDILRPERLQRLQEQLREDGPGRARGHARPVVPGTIWSAKDFNTRAYYVVLFVTFFFLMLLLYAFIQALIEALRSRIFTQHPVRGWRPARPRGPATAASRVRHRRLGRTASRPGFPTGDHACGTGSCLAGLLPGVLRHVLQRAPRTQPASDRRVREGHRRSPLGPRAGGGPHPGGDRARHPRGAEERGLDAGDEDVRVSISMLSEDESVLFYVAREQGSLGRGFDKRSVAWVSVYTDTALWWEKDYPLDTELLDNTSGGYPLLPAEKILLGASYQARAGQDYDAFLVLPVPWAKRASSDNVRKAGIQISFRTKDHMDALFRLPEDEKGRPLYSRWPSLLADPAARGVPVDQDAELRHVLRHSLLLMEDLLAPFNEAVFDMFVRPNLRPR